MRRSTLATIAMACSVVGTERVIAQTVFADDFDGPTTFFRPRQNFDSLGVHPPDVGVDPWYGNGVLRDGSDIGYPAPAANGGTFYAQPGYPPLRGYLTPSGSASTNNQIVNFSWELYLKSAGGGLSSSFEFGSWQTDVLTGPRGFDLFFKPDGTLDYYTNSTGFVTAPSFSFSTNQWVSASMTVNYSTGAAALAIGSQVVNFSVADSASHQLDVLTFQDYTMGSNLALIDNLNVRVVGVGGWNVNGSGDWNSGGNWSGGLPNSVDAAATFGGSISSQQTIYSNSAVTVGSIQFDNTNSYSLAGFGPLTLQKTAGSATVAVLQGTHQINLPLVIASSTDLQVAGGATLKISDPVTINAGMSLSSSGAGSVVYESTVTLQSGASFSLASSQHVSALTVGSNALATVNASGSRVLRTDALSISSSGGKLDLKDNKLITSASTGWNGSNYTGVAKLVKDARNGGGWNGSSGITTSMPQATSGITTLAVATASEVGKTVFGGQSVSGGDTLVMYTYNGDANLSGKVDADDYFVIDANYNKSGTAHGFAKGDFNYDGFINGDDYMLIDQAFSGQGTPFSPAAALGEPAGVSAVPEPAGLGLCALLGLRLMRRRRCGTSSANAVAQ